MGYRRLFATVVVSAALLGAGTVVAASQASPSKPTKTPAAPVTAMEKLNQLAQKDPARLRAAAAGFLAHSDPAIRAQAVRLLATVGNADQIASLQGMVASDPDAAVQAEAELALVQIQVRLTGKAPGRTAAVLASALRSNRAEVRRFAARVLAETPGPEAQQLRQQAAETETDESIREMLRSGTPEGQK